MTTILKVLVATVVLCGMSTPVFAQAEKEAEARNLFEAGRSAFSDGRFEEALHHFGRSYELSGRDQLLFNMASTQEKLGWRQDAVDTYERYLKAVPDAENKNYALSRIATLKQELAEQAATDKNDQVEPDDVIVEEDMALMLPTEPEEEESRSVAAPIALFVVAGVAGIGGVLTGVMASSASSDLGDSCPDGVCGPTTPSERSELESTLSRKNTLALVTDILLGVSLVSAVTAVILLVTGGKKKDQETPVVTASCHTRGCRADLSLQF